MNLIKHDTKKQTLHNEHFSILIYVDDEELCLFNFVGVRKALKVSDCFVFIIAQQNFVAVFSTSIFVLMKKLFDEFSAICLVMNSAFCGMTKVSLPFVDLNCKCLTV